MPIGVFEMVLGIVLITMVGKVLQARYEAGKSAPPSADDSAEARRMREEVQMLRERVQVLERVITDSNRSDELDREIERLRDKNRI